MKNKNLIIWGIIIVIIVFLVIWSVKNTNNIGPLGSEHSHADFKIYINGQALNFAHLEYMVRDKFVHVENMNGKEIHKHATGVTLGYFFKTLGFEFNEECFVTDVKLKYCNEGEQTLKFYVNGQRNYDYGNYEIKEGDKYLISYGDESEEVIQTQLESIISPLKN